MKRSVLMWSLFGVLGCATQSLAPPSQMVRRIAVLPTRGPSDAGEAATEPIQEAPLCVGDCDDTGSVTVDEIVIGVKIALGSLSFIDSVRRFNRGAHDSGSPV